MMNGFLLYLLKSALWLTGFTLVYLIFLRNERYFTLKRAFLLIGILVSLTFPLITIHYRVELPSPQDSSLLQPQEELYTSSAKQNENPGAFDYRHALLLLYLAGIVFMALKMIWQTVRLYKTINRNKKYIRESAVVVRSSDFSHAFSFLNYVFINPSVNEHEAEEIMNHELVHVKQKHWLDLMIAEILKLLQWANPFAWIYTGFIRLNHEYLADEEALQRSANPAMYRAALINQLFGSPVISLSNSFNHSLNRKRFEMMKKIITSPYRKLKVLLILPVFAAVLYAFATPEYHYAPSQDPPGAKTNTDLEIVKTPPASDITKSTSEMKAEQAPQKKEAKIDVKGTVLKEDGSPLSNAAVLVTGTPTRSNTDESGSFSLSGVPSGSRIIISCKGYLTQLLKPEANLKIQMLKDPEYKESPQTRALDNYLIVINGNVSDKPYSEINNLVSPNDIATISVLRGNDGVKKYGEKAKEGVVEIITKDKAKEMGIPVPFRRSKPEDYPTFTGNSQKNFSQWLLDKIRYPQEAVQKGIEGRVSVSLVVQPDGSVSNVKTTGDPLLSGAVADLVKSAPAWEPAVNPEARTPFNTAVNLKFQLPDKITFDDVFVVVEAMPMYPGGDAVLLDFIRNNTKYPQEALDQKIEGRVIVRFVVTAKGTVENATVLKSLHPLLDAEALRVVSLLGNFMPGTQGGKPVNVWYMVPVTFRLPVQE